jgi:predicted heme/steroid binding protein
MKSLMGVAMKKKSIVPISLLVFMMAGLLSACGASNAQKAVASSQASPGTAGKQVLTLQDLAQYDGQNGRPAYVAVDGVVYDVTNSSLWPNGKHAPCNLDAVAGKGMSQIIKAAPSNMRDRLKAFPVAGILTNN